MNKPRIVTLFSGGGGSDIGAIMAGCEVVHAVEYDAKIADVYKDNIGDHVEVCKVEDADPTPWIGVDGILASPVCKSFSVAKTNGVEHADDLSSADAVCRWIRVITPRFVVIENVGGYKRSRSFANILQTLRSLDYFVTFSIFNSADYGVPQTRERLILRACRNHKLHDVESTHCQKSMLEFHELQSSIFGVEKLPWVGWLEAIEDIVPDLQNTQFAPWQIDRLPSNILELLHSTLVQGDAAGDRQITTRQENEPSFSLTTSGGGRVHRAVLIDNTEGTREATAREEHDPAFTLTHSNSGRRLSSTPSAVLVNNNLSDVGIFGTRVGDEPAFTQVPSSDRMRCFIVHPTDIRTMPVREQEEPAWTQTASHGNGNYPKVFICDGQPNKNGESLTIRDGDEPMITVLASAGKKSAKAFLTDGKSGSDGKVVPAIMGDDPMSTLTAGAANQGARACIGYRIVKLDGRCLARFQSFPDWYKLPKNRSLAGTVIGNAVPPLLMKAVVESILKSLAC